MVEGEDLLQKAGVEVEVGIRLGKCIVTGKAETVKIPSILPELSHTCNIRKSPFQGKSNAAEHI